MIRHVYLLTGFILLWTTSVAADRGREILHKTDSAHKALKDVMIRIESKIYSSFREATSIKGVNYRSGDLNYFSMEGMRYYSLPKDNLYVQVMDRNKTVILLRTPAATPESERIYEMLNEQANAGSGHFIFQVVASDKDKIQLHITTLKRWDYNLVVLKIDPKSFLIKEITYVSRDEKTLGYHKIIVSHDYTFSSVPPEEADLNKVLARKKGKWVLSNALSDYSFLNRLEN